MKGTTGPIKHNGPVYIELIAESAEKAKEIARTIPGFTLTEHSDPIAMESGSFILSGHAKDLLEKDLPEHTHIWDRHAYQMHTKAK